MINHLIHKVAYSCHDNHIKSLVAQSVIKHLTWYFFVQELCVCVCTVLLQINEVSICNSMSSSEIWDKYHECYIG